MSRKFAVFAVSVGALLFVIFYVYVSIGTCGDGICEVGESSFFCSRDCGDFPRPLNAIGRFSGLEEEKSGYGIYLFDIEFIRKRGVYVREQGKTVEVAVPENYNIVIGDLHEVGGKGSIPDVRVPYYADAVEGYDEIVYDYKNFYDVAAGEEIVFIKGGWRIHKRGQSRKERAAKGGH